jgi:ribosomal protein S27E
MEAELVRCPGCGAENTAEAAFCAECGRRLRVPEGVKPKKRGLFSRSREEPPLKNP